MFLYKLTRIINYRAKVFEFKCSVYNHFSLDSLLRCIETNYSILFTIPILQHMILHFLFFARCKQSNNLCKNDI